MNRLFVTLGLLAVRVFMMMADKVRITHQPFGYMMCIQLYKDFDSCTTPTYVSGQLSCIVWVNGEMHKSCNTNLSNQSCSGGSSNLRTILTRTKGLRRVKNQAKKPGRKIFFMNTSLKTWDDALKYCKRSGGTLAMPKTKSEQPNILKIIHSNVLPFVRSPIFFGLRDFFENGTFLWEDGQALSYTNWVPGQPSHVQHNRAERCGCFRVNYGKAEGWTDDHCDMIAYYICQKRQD